MDQKFKCGDCDRYFSKAEIIPKEDKPGICIFCFWSVVLIKTEELFPNVEAYNDPVEMYKWYLETRAAVLKQDYAGLTFYEEGE